MGLVPPGSGHRSIEAERGLMAVTRCHGGEDRLHRLGYVPVSRHGACKISYGRSPTHRKATCAGALRMAAAQEFVARLLNGLDTIGVFQRTVQHPAHALANGHCVASIVVAIDYHICIVVSRDVNGRAGQKRELGLLSLSKTSVRLAKCSKVIVNDESMAIFGRAVVLWFVHRRIFHFPDYSRNISRILGPASAECLVARNKERTIERVECYQIAWQTVGLSGSGD
jgi:hypothetical protein